MNRKEVELYEKYLEYQGTRHRPHPRLQIFMNSLLISGYFLIAVFSVLILASSS